MKRCRCKYPLDNCGKEQYLYYKDGCSIIQQKVLPCSYDIISCCTTGKSVSGSSCGLLEPGNDRCNQELYSHCVSNFDDTCKTVCSDPNHPSWCDSIGEQECQNDPEGEICDYFCSNRNSHSYCPVKTVPYEPGQYSVLFYVACIICVLVLFLLIIL